MRAEALAARKRGAVESKNVVKKRLEEMLLEETEVMVYRLGGGSTWYEFWELLTTEQKREGRALMRAEALAACKRGAVESKNTVKQRLEEMLLEETEGMVYRLGGGSTWYEFWGLLTTEQKRECRALMREEAQIKMEEVGRLGVAEQAQRVTEMGLPSNIVYSLGHCHVYYAIWHLLEQREKEEAREQIRSNIFATRGAGSITTGRHSSLDAEYICAAKMHVAHDHYSDGAFYSHHLRHPVCGATLDISQRNTKGSWRHACKMNPPLSETERGQGKHKHVRTRATTFFRVCSGCLAINRSEGICAACTIDFR
jgi:hypothetical protein